MSITSKDPNLYDLISSELSYSNFGIITADTIQIRYKNYIVNTAFGIKECLLLDDAGNIIDGFVRTGLNNYTYKGKSFFELLGGIVYDHTKSMECVPISADLYINVVENFQGHVYNRTEDAIKILRQSDLGDSDIGFSYKNADRNINNANL